MEDKRCKHSKQRIKQALIECTKTISLDKLTIKELCIQADINRTTFYAHYTDINSLYLEVQNEAIATLETYYKNACNNITTYRTMLLSIFKYVDEHSDIILLLLKTNSYAFKLTNMKALHVFDDTHKISDQTAVDYTEEFLLSGAHSLIQKWIENGKKESVEYMVDLLYQITKHIK